MPVAGWEYLSFTSTSLEAIIGVTVGILAGSVALIGFAADSGNPIAALDLLPIIIRQGIAGWRGKTGSHADF